MNKKKEYSTFKEFRNLAALIVMDIINLDFEKVNFLNSYCTKFLYKFIF